jgi:DNA polymerase-2
MASARGFIVAAWNERPPDGPRSAGDRQRILLTGRLDDGRSFAAVLRSAPAALYVAPADGARGLHVLRESIGGATSLDGEPWTEIGGRALARLELPLALSGRAERALLANGVRTLQRERPRAEESLVALGLTGPCRIEGREQPGRWVDVVFVEPRLSPEVDVAMPSWLSIDLETDREGRVVAASLAGAGGRGEALFVGPAPGPPWIAAFDTEGALLAALAARLRARDPDVVTGWNVIEFDLAVLAGRFAAHGLSFDAGRTAEPAALVERPGRASRFRLPGRAVLDALRLVRGSGERFEDHSLQAVAQAVLGEGKAVAARGEAKLAELDRLRRDDPVAFCAYCLRDAELVLRILGRMGLDALTARRAALTGVPLELAWTSIPAFERVYAAELRARRVLPPPRISRPVSGAAGGTVLEALPGFFSNVLVFDFRSLYPSIIRTFNIDPLAAARAEARPPRADDLVAPNGARFDRAPGILPAIIARYAREREAALARGDATAAYVYKILQNSFYGVLGSEGCRYARTELAGAITSWGKRALHAARDHFAARGQRVIYGDTDSVFVLSDLADDAGFDELAAAGAEAADAINRELGRRIAADHGVESHLRIRCEKVYRRFFIPRLRADPSSDARGRAKGYAGLLLHPGGTTEVEVRGMEAARSDFTPLARRFQLELLTLAFAGKPPDELHAFCREVAGRLWRGELDGELVYRKSLRRPAEEYESETPQVKAARRLGWTGQCGRVEYVMTVAGAEPVDARSGVALDHAHYLERQLLPIARSVADALGCDPDAWLGDRRQLALKLD